MKSILNLFEIVFATQQQLETIFSTMMSLQATVNKNNHTGSDAMENALLEADNLDIYTATTTKFNFRGWVGGLHIPFLQDLFKVVQGFFGKINRELQPLLEECIKTPTELHWSVIGKMRLLIENETKPFKSFNLKHPAFRNEAFKVSSTGVYTEKQKMIQNQLTELTSNIYTKQKKIIKKGRRTALHLLILLETFFKQQGVTETQDDNLGGMTSGFNIGQGSDSATGAVDGAAASSLNITEGQSGQGHQGDEAME